jgi:predicted TIM-barrel fold metal-dependent hydrolase
MTYLELLRDHRRVKSFKVTGRPGQKEIAWSQQMRLPLPPLSRRHFLSASAIAASNLFFTGCWHHGMQIFKTGALATPPGVPANSPLTIDVHCHIFNGTDLQVEKFLGDVTFPTWWGKAAGEILELANWNLAPTGDEEKAKLEQLVHTCKAMGGNTRISRAVHQKLDEYRNEGYKRARQAVLEVQQKSGASQAPRTGMMQSYRSEQDAKHQIFASFAAPDYETFQQNLKTPPPLTDNMKQEISPQHERGALTIQSAVAKASAAAQPFSLQGAGNFIAQYFQYRYVSAQDYLNTFTPSARRDVDLMLASMVDYDWWLAQGDPSPTTLETQVDLMTLISILSDGRVHGFAPFCPLREVAARAGFKNNRGEVAKSSLHFVQEAVRSKGCVGVKLYPPMGFAAYGNAALDDPSRGGRADFWKGGLLPNWTSAPIPYSDGTTKLLGQRIDDSLDELYQWCLDEQVPILAHTDETNGPSDQYKALAGAQYWASALSKYPSLRVNFGHLGGLDNWGPDMVPPATLPATSQAFVAMLGAAGSPTAYGDAAYSSNMLLIQTDFDERIQTLYQQAAAGKNQLPSHLLYGTDWSLLEQIGNNDEYMKRFTELFAQFSGAACAGHSAEDCFFGWNAVEYLGLRPGVAGKTARSRLEAFYALHCMPRPIWMQKLANS